MKTIVEINSTNYASTGNIMLNIAIEARKQGLNVITFSKDSKESRKHNFENHLYIGTRIERVLSEKLSYYTGLRDHFNIIGTYCFINKLKSIKPNLIHIHTLHDTFVNSKMLFNYIKKNNIPVIWTFHDCCAFTGQCPYFDIVNCEKWKNGCFKCPQTKIAPASFIDSTKKIYNQKKEWFSNVNKLIVVTPSKWLKGLVEQSFFKQYETRVINNGINLDVFKPIESDFKEKYNLQDKFILLGVANRWSIRKGIDTFVKLANSLDDKYQIVLVGTNDEVDKLLPKNVISIHRTYNQEELVKIYSACDLFVNPTMEENFPTVNIEALACGLPIITYDTGGSPEIINEECGLVIPKGNIDLLIKGINDIFLNKPYKKGACINRSQMFSSQSKFIEYVELYKEILEPRI